MPLIKMAPPCQPLLLAPKWRGHSNWLVLGWSVLSAWLCRGLSLVTVEVCRGLSSCQACGTHTFYKNTRTCTRGPGPFGTKSPESSRGPRGSPGYRRRRLKSEDVIILNTLRNVYLLLTTAPHACTSSFLCRWSSRQARS